MHPKGCFRIASVVQWIEQFRPKELMSVRFWPEAPHDIIHLWTKKNSSKKFSS